MHVTDCLQHFLYSNCRWSQNGSNFLMKIEKLKRTTNCIKCCSFLISHRSKLQNLNDLILILYKSQKIIILFFSNFLSLRNMFEQDSERKMFRVRRQFMRSILEENKRAEQIKQKNQNRQKLNQAQFEEYLRQNSLKDHQLFNSLEREKKYEHKEILLSEYDRQIREKQSRKLKQKQLDEYYAGVQYEHLQYMNERRIQDMMKVFNRKKILADKYTHGHQKKDLPNPEQFHLTTIVQKPSNIVHSPLKQSTHRYQTIQQRLPQQGIDENDIAHPSRLRRNSQRINTEPIAQPQINEENMYRYNIVHTKKQQHKIPREYQTIDVNDYKSMLKRKSMILGSLDKSSLEPVRTKRKIQFIQNQSSFSQSPYLY